MTISALPPFNEYTAAAGQRDYVFTFRIYAAPDIRVTVNGNPVGIDRVDGVGFVSGGMVRISVDPAEGDVVRVSSQIPLDRTVDYVNSGALRAETLNLDFDRVVSLIKQVEAQRSGAMPILPTPAAADATFTVVGSMGELLRVLDTTRPVFMRTFDGDPRGGGFFVWDPTFPHSFADGGFAVDPTSAGGYSGGTALLGRFLSLQGTGTGTGCWVRWDIFHCRAEFWGASDRHDALLPLNRAISHAERIGKPIVLEPGRVYQVSGQLNLAGSGVVLQGGQSDVYHDGPSTVPASVIRRITNTGDAVVNISSNFGRGSPRHSGSGLRNVQIDGNNLAATGVLVQSHSRAVLENVYIHSATQFGMSMNTHNANSIGEIHDTRYCQVRNLTINCGYPAQNTASAQATGMKLDGRDGANVSFNHFQDIVVYHTNGPGVVLGDTDNNTFENLRIFRAAAPTGGNVSLTLQAGTSSETACRANRLRGVSARNVFVQGTDQGDTQASYNNYIEFEEANFNIIGASNFTVGAGALVEYDTEYVPPDATDIRTIKHRNLVIETIGRRTVPASGSLDVTLPVGYRNTTEPLVAGHINGDTTSSPSVFLSSATQVTLRNPLNTPAVITFRIIGTRANA